MHYTNSQMKLDQLIGYFNGKKISLIPPFQRGRAWKLQARQKLLVNMVRGRPIPAIFLYKQADGSQFAYNILDGKQRLESLILFIGTKRADLRVDGINDYFFNKSERQLANFEIELDGKPCAFKDLPNDVVRQFREYAIPTIEIDLDEQGTLDEIIHLFVDINQTGEKVKRFDIVKAIGNENKLLKSAFSLIATAQIRANDRVYVKKSTSFSRVLDRLQVVQAATERNQKVDRMWERMVEVALFNRTATHRQPGQILATFIKSDNPEDKKAISTKELKKLRRCFDFLDKAYKDTTLGSSRFARDLPHFYTMVTTLLSSDLLDSNGAAPKYQQVRDKLVRFAALLPDGARIPPGKRLEAPLAEYKDTAAKQTTHPGRRKTRAEMFLAIMRAL